VRTIFSDRYRLTDELAVRRILLEGSAADLATVTYWIPRSSSRTAALRPTGNRSAEFEVLEHASDA
jgi:hypothetical protein